MEKRKNPSAKALEKKRYQQKVIQNKKRKARREFKDELRALLRIMDESK